MNSVMDLALEAGFTSAYLVDTKDIPVNHQFRMFCEDNVCGQYGANYSCPPVCGTPEEMEARIRGRRQALVLQSTWEVDFQDKEGIRRCKNLHNQWSRSLKNQLREQTEGFLVGASGCGLCKPCAMTEGKPCRFPAEMASCMSAYCINVYELSQRCHMPYMGESGIVYFFGMYVFDWKDGQEKQEG